ncbi:MAG: NTP transferase domain-containing protein [Cellulosilyticaceae bacterium]
MIDNYFNILKQINNQKVESQRQLVTVTNMSLGKINKILKECINKGYIYFDENQPLYTLTIEGREYLRNSIKNFKQTKLHINNNNNNNKINTAVILGAGEAKEFGKPIGSLLLDEISIVGRQIEILRKYDIQNIFIVGGYKQEVYRNLTINYGCEFVENSNYTNTGNMYSLKLLEKLIKEDFLLIEGDLVFEDNAIITLLEDKKREGIVVTKINGFGDEEYVELKDGNITKISKDIHQLDKVHGELMGISKISIELYHLMLKELSSESNPYLSYEYVLFELAKDYCIPYIRLEDTIWGEVDNKMHYEMVLTQILPSIKKRESENGKSRNKKMV